VLVNRGYVESERATRFLDAPLEALTDPEVIIDLPLAADRLVAAIRSGELVTIYGDYDADGVTATTILLRGLRALGARTEFYIPSRFSEGYGINGAALRRIAEGGTQLVVSVDCGVTAVAEVEEARARELEIIVVDHHEPGPMLPPAYAVVDPKRTDGPEFREYSAAGLAFQLLRAVRHRLGRRDLPLDVLELAALGTIADVVPLVDDNRIIARHGLAKMETSAILGLSSLIRAAGLSGPVTARHVGFSLGPRINAAGRLGDAKVAVRLLTTDDPVEAEAIAQQLDAENRRRRELCDQVLAEAVEQVERERLQDGSAIVLSREGWHAGVIGIVASQLVERYYRPVVMIAVEHGVGKGSARSIEALHLVDTLTDCGDLLDRFGGHAMAAGLTITEERVTEFTQRFADAASRRLGPEDLVPSLPIDAEVQLVDLTGEVARQLQRLAPFGAGNPEPVLAARGLRAVTTRVMGDGLHLKLGVTDGEGFAEAVGFRLGDASELLAFTRAQIDLAFTVEIDMWEQRERVQLVLRDLLTPGVDLDVVLADTALLLDRLFSRSEDYLGDGALGLEEAGAFHTKVAGVTFEGRQTIIQSLSPGQPLVLQREPSNPHDPHAVKVLKDDGQQVGYLSARVAARLAPTIDSGVRYSANVAQITGGGEDRSFGVNIYLQREEVAADDVDPGRLLRTSWQDLSEGELLDRLRVHLNRGRPFRPPQLEVLQHLMSGDSVSGVFGPGRGRRVLIGIAAAAVVISKQRPRSGPVVIAVPGVGQVERWYERIFPALKQVGVHCVRAHGGLLFRQRQRLAQSLASGTADVVLATFEYLVTKGRSLRPALLLIDAAHGPARISPEELIAATEPAQAGVFDSEAAARGRTHVIDAFLRTNIRLVDRRNGDDQEAMLAGIIGRGEKTLVYTSSRASSVEVAQNLKGSTGRDVAYCHAGLPIRVREVLEQVFADGKIGVMVVADGLDETAFPGDVRQVAVLGLPHTVAELVEQIGTAGMDGRQAHATLLYGRSDLEAARFSLAERNPTRDTLAAIYRAVREQAANDRFASWPDPGLTAALGPVASPRVVGIGLDVLAEAGVIQREYEGDHWRITVGDGARRELSTSLRYAEGEREREALDELAEFAFGPLPEILKAVAGPTAGNRDQ
jgi:single-stranded-DNA-specific exonuclease